MYYSALFAGPTTTSRSRRENEGEGVGGWVTGAKAEPFMGSITTHCINSSGGKFLETSILLQNI